MIGVWSSYSRHFLLVLAPLILLLFGFPLLFAPLRWARIYQWRAPDDDHLVLYFGRCLGGVTCVVAMAALGAAILEHSLGLIYSIVLGAAVLMAGIHLYGAVRRIQPWTETLEIGFWVALFVLALCFYPLTTSLEAGR